MIFYIQFPNLARLFTFREVRLISNVKITLLSSSSQSIFEQKTSIKYLVPFLQPQMPPVPPRPTCAGRLPKPLEPTRYHCLLGRASTIAFHAKRLISISAQPH